VAKSGKSRKSASKRPRAASRGGAKRTRSTKAQKPNRIELRRVRAELRSHVHKLGVAIGTTESPDPKLEETLKRLSRWLDDIEAICGSNMSVPLS
jgi:hypothetical protein